MSEETDKPSEVAKPFDPSNVFKLVTRRFGDEQASALLRRSVPPDSSR